MSAQRIEPASEPRISYGRRHGRLGDIVVDLGFCSRETVEAVAQSAREAGKQVGQVLVERGAITSDQLAIAIAKRFGLEHLSLDELTVDFAAAQLLPAADARRLGVVPIAFAGDDGPAGRDGQPGQLPRARRRVDVHRACGSRRSSSRRRTSTRCSSASACSTTSETDEDEAAASSRSCPT